LINEKSKKGDKIMTIQQISVFLENRAGELAQITNILAENNINLRAIHIADTSDYGVLRIIVDRPRDAVDILVEKNFILSITPVLAVAVPDDAPGGLAKLLTILAKADMDIEYMYSVFGRKDGMCYMIFRVADIKRLEDIFVANQIQSVSGEALGIQ